MLALLALTLVSSNVRVAHLSELIRIQSDLIKSLAKRDTASRASRGSPSPSDQDPIVTAILSTARLLPVYEGEELVALRLTNIAQGSRWEQLGVRDGDHLVRVGDIEITSPLSSAEALAFLKENWTSVRLERLSAHEVSLFLPASQGASSASH